MILPLEGKNMTNKNAVVLTTSQEIVLLKLLADHCWGIASLNAHGFDFAVNCRGSSRLVFTDRSPSLKRQIATIVPQLTKDLHYVIKIAYGVGGLHQLCNETEAWNRYGNNGYAVHLAPIFAYGNYCIEIRSEANPSGWDYDESGNSQREAYDSEDHFLDEYDLLQRDVSLDTYVFVQSGLVEYDQHAPADFASPESDYLDALQSRLGKKDRLPIALAHGYTKETFEERHDYYHCKRRALLLLNDLFGDTRDNLQVGIDRNCPIYKGKPNIVCYDYGFRSDSWETSSSWGSAVAPVKDGKALEGLLTDMADAIGTAKSPLDRQALIARKYCD